MWLLGRGSLGGLNPVAPLSPGPPKNCQFDLPALEAVVVQLVGWASLHLRRLSVLGSVV